MVVQSDYSVSSLSEKESKERERELDNHDNFSMGGIREGKGLFFIFFLVHYVQKIICRHLTFFMYWGRVGILIYHLAQI